MYTRHILKLKISLLAHKISQNEANIPEVFQNYLVKVSDIHSHNTRYASNLNFHVLRVRSNYGKHTFKVAQTCLYALWLCFLMAFFGRNGLIDSHDFWQP